MQRLNIRAQARAFVGSALLASAIYVSVCGLVADVVVAQPPMPAADVAVAKPIQRKPFAVGRAITPQPKSTTWLEWATTQIFGPPDAPAKSTSKPAHNTARITRTAANKINIAVPAKAAVVAPAVVSPPDTPPPGGIESAATPVTSAAPPALRTGSLDRAAVTPATSLGTAGGLSSRAFALLAMLREGRDVPRPQYHPIRAETASRDMIALELASRAYDETRAPGHPAFTSRPDWLVLEHAHQTMDAGLRPRAEASGFDATAYVNHSERRIIVAIAGSCARLWLGSRKAAIKSQEDCRKDWIDNDIKAALIERRTPAQFAVARDYVASVAARHRPADGGTHYAIECSGHSLGGGACAFAAADLGLRATTLNPISAGVLKTEQPGQIANYVVEGDLARVVYGLRGLAPTGIVYVIDDGRDHLRPILQAAQYGPVRGTAYFFGRKLVESFLDHTLNHGLDRLAGIAKVARVL